jgi:hypothetical protein
MPPVPQGNISLWLEERELPPLDHSVLIKAATFIPMSSSEWQAGIDPTSSEPPTDDKKFRYDGNFQANPAVPGKWTTVAEVAAIADFDPAAKPNPGRAPLRNIEFKNDGLSDDPNWIWSGDRLMNIERFTAHRITPKKIGDADYLFIESGGFNPNHPAGWTSPWMVLKRN